MPRPPKNGIPPILAMVRQKIVWVFHDHQKRRSMSNGSGPSPMAIAQLPSTCKSGNTKVQMIFQVLAHRRQVQLTVNLIDGETG